MDAIRATLDAAYIQGFFGFLGALVGAGVLIWSLRVTARNTLEAFKLEKLAEAKRDTYIELVRKWQSFLISCNSYRILEEHIFYDQYFIALKDLTASLHESSFISDPSTKEKIMNFTIRFGDSIASISKYFNKWYSATTDEEKRIINIELFEFMDDFALEALKLQDDLRTELGLPNNDEVNKRLLENQKKFAARIKSKLD